MDALKTRHNNLLTDRGVKVPSLVCQDQVPHPKNNQDYRETTKFQSLNFLRTLEFKKKDRWNSQNQSHKIKIQKIRAKSLNIWSPSQFLSAAINNPRAYRSQEWVQTIPNKTFWWTQPPRWITWLTFWIAIGSKKWVSLQTTCKKFQNPQS